mgnify:CR=1 FL=1
MRANGTYEITNSRSADLEVRIGNDMPTYGDEPPTYGLDCGLIAKSTNATFLVVSNDYSTLACSQLISGRYVVYFASDPKEASAECEVVLEVSYRNTDKHKV